MCTKKTHLAWKKEMSSYWTTPLGKIFKAIRECTFLLLTQWKEIRDTNGHIIILLEPQVSVCVSRDVSTARAVNKNLQRTLNASFFKHWNFKLLQSSKCFFPSCCSCTMDELPCVQMINVQSAFTELPKVSIFSELIENLILRGRHTSMICDIKNGLEAVSDKIFSIDERDVELWGLECINTFRKKKRKKRALKQEASRPAVKVIQKNIYISISGCVLMRGEKIKCYFRQKF